MLFEWLLKVDLLQIHGRYLDLNVACYNGTGHFMHNHSMRNNGGRPIFLAFWILSSEHD